MCVYKIHIHRHIHINIFIGIQQLCADIICKRQYVCKLANNPEAMTSVKQDKINVCIKLAIVSLIACDRLAALACCTLRYSLLCCHETICFSSNASYIY